MAAEIVQVLAGYGPWGVLFLVIIRSGPSRSLSWVVSTEIRRRYGNYLRRRGVPEAEIRRLLAVDRDEGTDDQGEPPKAVA